jgi:hypothetical protein
VLPLQVFGQLVDNLPTARYNLAGAGTANSWSLAFGGQLPLLSYRCNRRIQWNKLDSSSWNGFSTAKIRLLAGAGTQTAALAFGGDPGSTYYKCNRRI